MKKILFICFISIISQPTFAQTSEEWYSRGRAEIKKVQFDTAFAMKCFSEALKLYPKLADAYKWRSWLYEQRNNDAAALEDISLYLQFIPDPKAYYRRALLNERLRRHSEALSDYAEAVRLADNETDKAVFLQRRIELFDTLAAMDRRLLNALKEQK